MALGGVLAVFPLLAQAQDAKPPVPPPVDGAAATPSAAPVPGTGPNLRATKPVVKDVKDPSAPGAPTLPAQPGGKNEPLFIPDIPTPAMPGVPQGPGARDIQKPPLQRMYTVGKFAITYGTDVRERNPKLPKEAELSASVVTLIEGKNSALYHVAKSPTGGASKSGGGLFGVTHSEQNERAEKFDGDQALHPPMPVPAVPVTPVVAPGAKPDAKAGKKEIAKADKNVPKAVPKPILPDGKPVKLKVSVFGEPRAISAMAMLDVYDAVVKKLTDRGLIGVYIMADVNPRKGVDERLPGVLDVKVTVFISEVAKIRTIARKVPFKFGDLPKINDDDAPDGQVVKDPKHLWIKAKSPVFVFKPKKGGSLLEKPRLQDYLSRLNRFPGRRVDAAINATGETGKVMLDYLIREQKKFLVYVQESNTGTKSTGEWRSRIGLEFRQLLNKDDILRMEFTTTNLDQYNAAVLNYQFALMKPDVLKMRLYGLFGQYSAEDVGYAGLNFKGESITGGAALTWTPIYWHGFPLDVTAGGEFMRSTVNNAATGTTSTVNFILPYLGVGTERTTDKFSLATNWQAKGSLTDQNQDQLNGLGRFGTNGAFWFLNGDLTASIFLEPLLLGKKWGDLGPDGTKWKRGILANELAVIAHGQYAMGNRRLVPQLELLAGGYNTVRGYPESFTAGDSGFVTSLEYRLHVPRLFKPADISAKQKKAKADKLAKNAPAQKPGDKPGASSQAEPVVTALPERGEKSSASFRLRPGGAGSGADWDFIVRGFLDYGQTYNNRIITSVEANRTLMSTGAGIELQLFKPIFMTIRADYGYVLQSQRNLTADPVNAGDSRLHISATIAW
jgi:hemolysin activation/secretion protein